MSGEFGERMREVMNLKYSTVDEANTLNYLREEILAVVEVARKTSDGPTANWAELRRVLDALDEKARTL